MLATSQAKARWERLVGLDMSICFLACPSFVFRCGPLNWVNVETTMNYRLTQNIVLCKRVWVTCPFHSCVALCGFSYTVFYYLLNIKKQTSNSILTKSSQWVYPNIPSVVIVETMVCCVRSLQMFIYPFCNHNNYCSKKRCVSICSKLCSISFPITRLASTKASNCIYKSTNPQRVILLIWKSRIFLSSSISCKVVLIRFWYPTILVILRW